MHAWGGSYATGGFFPEITMFVFWITVLIGIVFLVRYLHQNVTPIAIQNKETSAIEILEERYARGEIGKDEFQEKIQILRT